MKNQELESQRPDKDIKRHMRGSRRIQKAAAAVGVVAGLAAVQQNHNVVTAGLIATGIAAGSIAVRRDTTKEFIDDKVMGYWAACQVRTGSAGLLRDSRIDVGRYDTPLRLSAAVSAPVAAYTVAALMALEASSEGENFTRLGIATVAAGVAIYGFAVGEKHYSNLEQAAALQLDTIEGVDFVAPE